MAWSEALAFCESCQQQFPPFSLFRRASSRLYEDIQEIAPNMKWRSSGVTSTIVRLVPLQANSINIVASGLRLPRNVPQIPLWKVLFLPRCKQAKPVWRLWHARRNIEMLTGVVLQRLFRRRLALAFTSSKRRFHTRYSQFLIRRMDAVVATSQATQPYLPVFIDGNPPRCRYRGLLSN